MRHSTNYCRWLMGITIGLAALMGHAAPQNLDRYIESPMLARSVAKGEIPPVQARLPKTPMVVRLSEEGKQPGRHGGDLRLLMGKSKDVRMMVVYGYARLVGYDERFEFAADILEGIEVTEARTYTLRLREGHRWSDGHPFTAEDFRFWWEDVANNEELSPFGFHKWLLVDGEPPQFEILNETTIRFRWKGPNPFFLQAMASTRPLFIYCPAHYLKQFHPRYQEPDKLAAMVEKEGMRDWTALFTRKNTPYKNNNPEMPSLQPWVNTTAGPSDRYVFVRNPYYYRVDADGRQLPYIDRVIMQIADGKLIPAKTGAGESDLQARNLHFSDYTFLKKSEQYSDARVRLWDTTKGAHVALYPNLSVVDPVWRTLFRDVRFRRALSVAIDRHELNQVLYFGLATEGNNCVHSVCSLYEQRYRTAWAQFDLQEANRLLDELGLDRRNKQGLRLLPDGRPAVIIVETAGEDTEQTDLLELIHDTWLKAGIKLYTKPLQREVFRNRIFAGKTMMAVWGGLENGVPNANVSPQPLAPTSQQQLQWPKWGQYYETKGGSGEPVDLAEAQELLELNEAWTKATTFAERERLWHQILGIHADQVFTIGLVAGVPQPVVVNQRLHNVPMKGVYNWDPGAHFGGYRPDTFWFDEERS